MTKFYDKKQLKKFENGIKLKITNEIKEIIEYLKDDSMFISDEDGTRKEITLDESKLLLDYITNLQQRIDKTLNYIKKQKPWWEEWHYDMCGVDDIKEIEKILRGDE